MKHIYNASNKKYLTFLEHLRTNILCEIKNKKLYMYGYKYRHNVNSETSTILISIHNENSTSRMNQLSFIHT